MRRDRPALWEVALVILGPIALIGVVSLGPGGGLVAVAGALGLLGWAAARWGSDSRDRSPDGSPYRWP